MTKTRPLLTATGVDLSRPHLIGVGGAGMSAIATVLLGRGVPVSGSDAKDSHALTALAARGAHVAVGQRADNLDLMPGGASCVVISTAIRADNVELLEAERRGLPVVRRADALAALMAGHRSVCIAGTHGKTSTTSMLTVALQHAGLDPSFAIGGELGESGAGAHAGTGDIFVAEADESDGSFLAFSPCGAVITTIEPDHLDHHGTPEAYVRVFDEFAAGIGRGGFLVAGIDDPGVDALVERMRAGEVGGGAVGPVRGRESDGSDTAGGVRIVTYGERADSDIRIMSMRPDGHRMRAVLRLPDGSEQPIVVDAPGRHMVANASAAVGVGLLLGIGPDVMAEGLAAFSGVRRRFEFRGRAGGVRVYDDYAHHPTEVAATVAGARAVAGAGRIVVVFQPHLYSRTSQFAEAFARALQQADVVVVLDVYGAREDPVPGVTGRLIAEAIDPAAAEVRYVPSMQEVPAVVAMLARAGDVVLTMGAGDVTLLGPEILSLIPEPEAGAR